MQLKQVKAIITGGASGLGYACAKSLIENGATVCLVDVNEENGNTAIQNLNSEKAKFILADVTSESEIEKACQQAQNFNQGLNTVINCAGILAAGRVLGREAPMGLDYFQKAIQVNLVGSFNVCKSAANLMQSNSALEDNERGIIINTASIAAYEGQIGQAAYSASKGGIIGMTLPMAREFARCGIRVMAVAPGVFMTPMVSGMPDHVKEALGAGVPFPSRLGTAEEFAMTVGHIIENTYLNGSVIRLDGAIRLEPK